ncbi:MAG: hypothetical protein V1799_07435 [bacterium]
MRSWYRVEIKMPVNLAPPLMIPIGAWIDVTDNVADEEGIMLEESADLTDKVIFTLRSTPAVSVMRFIDSLAEGAQVRLWFGYMNGSVRLNQDTEMFSGYIGRLRDRYPKGGRPKLEVTAFDASWLMTQRKPGIQKVYPATRGMKMTYEHLVRKVMEPYMSVIKIGTIEIPPAFKAVVFDEKNPAIQKADETDWKFLKRIANDDLEGDTLNAPSSSSKEAKLGCECITYVELKNGVSSLHFIPELKKMSEFSSIELFYPMHGSDIPSTQDVMATKGKMIVDSIEIDDDRELASEVVIQVPAEAFSEVLTQEQIKSVNAGSGGSGFNVDVETFFNAFEINYDLIRRDENAGLIGWGAIDFAAGRVGYDQVKRYINLKIEFRPAGQKSMVSAIPVTPEDMKNPAKRADLLKKAIGKRKKSRRNAGFSMTVELEAGNPNIRPRKVYPVVNIGGKYGLEINKKAKWFAETVTHRLGRTFRQTIKLTM